MIDISSTCFTLDTETTIPSDLENCILVSADIEDVIVDIKANDVVLNSYNGDVIINMAFASGQILRITYKKVI